MSEGGPIEVVVSDFGGVLTTPLMRAFAAIQTRASISAEVLGEAIGRAGDTNGENPLFELERGEIPESEFLDRLGVALTGILGHRPDLDGFRHAFFGALEPNEPMIALMRELRDAGYGMALLTNNVREWEPLWRSMLPIDEIFETIVDSAFVGMRKPEAGIYELLLERVSRPAEACLFVDDVALNCDAARTAGIATVHFRDNDQAITEIRSALGAGLEKA